MSARVTELGWTPVRGTRWLSTDALEIDAHGVVADRQWTVIDSGFHVLPAVKFPQLLSVPIVVADLPTDAGEPGEVNYFGRRFAATLHDNALSKRVGELVSMPVRLAHKAVRPGFVWDAGVSLIEESELADLPGPTTRYRANLIVAELPTEIGEGTRLRIGEACLEIERRIDRCRVTEHNPETSVADARVLSRLGADRTLGWGCRVIEPGRVSRRARPAAGTTS